MKERIEKVLPESYLLYAGYVAQHRAIVDARDFLKDGARKIIYAQWKNGITHDKPFKKGTKNVAAVMSYSVHGSGPIYANMVRMAQPFALRYPLVDYDGGVGTLVNGNDFSADRYLELRSSSVAAEMTKNLKKETVEEWKDNYDETEKYPAVLPSYFPNICNGVSGIGVGLACSIPPFNIVDVSNALLKMIENEDVSFEEIYCPVDFPTGGIVINENEVKESLRNGYGKAVKIYAKMEYDGNKNEIVVKELPYQVFTSTVCEQLQKAIADGKLFGVESFFDGTDFGGVNIRIKLTKHGNPKKIMSLLYKHTSLGHHYGINMVMLENGRVPRIFTWKAALETYLSHLKNTIRRSYEYDLKKVKARLHIVEGLLKAVDIIDEVVATIRASQSPTAAKTQLISKYGFSELQVSAILDMKLSKLTGLEKNKLVQEKNNLNLDINRISHILGEGFIDEVRREITHIREKYRDSRRTTVLNLSIDENNEPVEEKTLVVYFSEKGAVQAQESESLLVQSRGGRGAKIKLRDGDFVKEAIHASNGSWVIVFTSTGRAHTFYLNDLEIGVETHLRSILDLDPDEEVMAILPYNKAEIYDNVIIATRKGYLKKTSLKDFVSKTNRPVISIKLREKDEVVSVVFANKDNDLLVTSKEGNCIRISESAIPSSGRSTMGVQGIKLSERNECISVVVIDKDTREICSVSSDGLVKRTAIEEFSKTNRATKGVLIQKMKEGSVVLSVAAIAKEKAIMAVSKTNTIKISMDQVPQSKRNTAGVLVMKNGKEITKIIPVE